MSPQAGLDTSTVRAGGGSAPTFRGLRKWSRKRSLYNVRSALTIMPTVKPTVNARLAVVRAVIRRNGLVLIGQRLRNSRHGLKWEFPGGKVEPGENPPQAL